MTATGPRRRRGRILFSILILLFAIGVVPLLWTSYSLSTSSRESLELTQRESQLDKAQSLSSQVELYVSSLRDHVSAIDQIVGELAGHELEGKAGRFE